MLSRRNVLGAAMGGALGLGTALDASRRAPPHGYRSIAIRRAAVALTFDDGPDPRFTPSVLDHLAAAGARATFFVVGLRVAAHPDLVRRIAAEGHEVANHTLSHERLDRLGRRGVRTQLEGGASAIEALSLPGGARSRLIRPPFGFVGGAALAEMAAGGWETARWRGCLEHYLNQGRPTSAVARLVAAARNGDILLAHDGGLDRATTVASLPALLRALSDRGMAVVSIGELASPPGGTGR